MRLPLPVLFLSFVKASKKLLLGQKCRVGFTLLQQLLGITGQALHQRFAVGYGSYALPKFGIHRIELYCCHNLNSLFTLQSYEVFLILPNIHEEFMSIWDYIHLNSEKCRTFAKTMSYALQLSE